MESENYKKTVLKVGIVTIIWNVILTLGKVIVGIIAKSSSLISDGVHSGSDVISTIIVMIGARLSTKKADKDHPYGHERIESIATIILALLLFATALLLGYQGVMSIIRFANGEKFEKTNIIWVAFGFAVASIIIKFWMFLYTKKAAKRINSTSLKADAYHHLSDSLSSIGSLLGIIGLIIGGNWAILDPIASIIISLFIIRVAYVIGKEGIDQVVDKTAPEEFQNMVKDITLKIEGVKKVNDLKTRQFGNKYYVDIEIAVDGSISVKEGHNIANKVHDALEHKFENIKHCMVHVDPFEDNI